MSDFFKARKTCTSTFRAVAIFTRFCASATTASEVFCKSVQSKSGWVDLYVRNIFACMTLGFI